MRVLAIALLAGLVAAEAQTPGPLAFACTEDDVDAFGLTCSEEEPCAVFMEIAAVEASGNTIFLSGNLHTLATTMYGFLVASDDGGKTWTEPVKRIQAAALDQIQFIDFSHGWVSGVKVNPLPQDPFMLLTSDGGKTWRERALFDDTHFGSIQQFWFESSTSGELIVDSSQGATKRYELYTSETGGDSWDVKEVGSKPLRLSKARPRAEATWRVRPDSPAKAYRLERRTAEKWETAATFDIHVGDCK